MEEEDLEDFNDFFDGLNDIRETANDLSGIRSLGRVPRVEFRDQENPLEAMREKEFKENLAFTKDGFLHILELFKDKIRRPCPNEISPLLKLTVYLQYVRSNDFLKSTRNQFYIRLPKSTICNILNDVSKDIASFSSTYIKFPDLEEQEIIANYFAENFNFPGVIGIIGKLLNYCSCIVHKNKRGNN